MKALRILSAQNFLSLHGRRMIPKRNVALDRDNYELKYPAATMTIIGASACAYLMWKIYRIRRLIEETKVNRLPLSERERDPDMNYFLTNSNKYRPRS